MRSLLLLLLCWLSCCGAGAAQEPVVPDWFRPDPKNPAAIFEAWKQLSTREAALYWGHDWNVLGGVLQDEIEDPIGNSILSVTYHDGIRGYHATLQTDDQGRFLIYGPRGGLPLNLDQTSFARFFSFQPVPGYPNTDLGGSFAQKQKDYPHCTVHMVNLNETSCFCYLTCHRASKFETQEFEKFKAEQIANWENPHKKAWKARPHAREGKVGRGIRNEYQVKVVSPANEAIANAIIKFGAYDDFEGNSQIVLTDAVGSATLVEELLKGRKPEYYHNVRRRLTVDIPEYAIGPVPFEMRTDRVNMITAKPGAQVSGRVLDWKGNPTQASLNIRYEKQSSNPFELSTSPNPDGYFTIDRIMPDEPFQIHIERGSHQWTPSSEVWSESLILKAGETRTGIALTVPQPAALRGIVVDEQDRPVPGIWKLSFYNIYGGWGNGDPINSKFGTSGVVPLPTRIEVEATGFEPYHGEEIPLEPGEMRFVKVVMKRERPKPAKVPKAAVKK